MGFIESEMELRKKMTMWLRKLMKDYNEADDLTIKMKLASDINQVFKNFVKLHKTLATQQTKVNKNNILQQKFETAKRVVEKELTAAKSE